MQIMYFILSNVNPGGVRYTYDEKAIKAASLNSLNLVSFYSSPQLQAQP